MLLGLRFLCAFWLGLTFLCWKILRSSLPPLSWPPQLMTGDEARKLDWRPRQTQSQSSCSLPYVAVLPLTAALLDETKAAAFLRTLQLCPFFQHICKFSTKQDLQQNTQEAVQCNKKLRANFVVEAEYGIRFCACGRGRNGRLVGGRGEVKVSGIGVEGRSAEGLFVVVVGRPPVSIHPLIHALSFFYLPSSCLCVSQTAGDVWD